jgi:hypothetical protein
LHWLLQRCFDCAGRVANDFVLCTVSGSDDS